MNPYILLAINIVMLLAALAWAAVCQAQLSRYKKATAALFKKDRKPILPRFLKGVNFHSYEGAVAVFFPESNDTYGLQFSMDIGTEVLKCRVIYAYSSNYHPEGKNESLYESVFIKDGIIKQSVFSAKEIESGKLHPSRTEFFDHQAY